jgi:YbbR domain-containing protein
MKFNREKIEKLLKNDIALKIISLVLALVLFVSINQIGNPIWNDIFKSTEYIQSVPIQLEYDEDKYVVTGVPDAIPVTITGTENNVASEKRRQESLVGVLSLESRTAGEYEIDTNQIDFNTQTSVIVDPAVENFDIKIQQKVTKEVPITVNYINGEGAASGYILESPKLSQSTVKVTGGNEDVDSIVSVMGFIDLSTLQVNEDSLSQEFEVSLVAYDANGDVVPNVELETKKITVVQDYEVNFVELPVNYEYVNNQTGKYVSSICEVSAAIDCSSTSQTTVKVYGDSNKIKNIDSITYKIDLTGFKGTTGEVVGTPVLDSGVYVMGDYEKTYNITLEEGVTKEIENVPFQVINLNPTLQAKTAPGETATIDVTVTGAASVVEALTKDDIILSLDLSDVSKPGSYSIPIRVKTLGDYDYELSKDRMNIEVWEVTNG